MTFLQCPAREKYLRDRRENIVWLHAVIVYMYLANKILHASKASKHGTDAQVCPKMFCIVSLNPDAFLRKVDKDGGKMIKGKATRKHSLRGKTEAAVLLKLFISDNERCHSTDAS